MPTPSQLETASSSSLNDDDKALIELGYVPSFKREFSNLATISFAFSIMGLCSSIATTFNTPLLLGGPSSVVWCWILGASMCFALGASIAEIVSAFPTCGGLYTASAQLCRPKNRAIVGWVVGWLNILGQIAGVASTEFGLSNMIWAAVSIGRNGEVAVTQNKVVGLFVGLLILHGILNSLATKYLALFTKSFVFINLGTTVIIIITLLATTPRSAMHSASYVFGSAGFVNGTGGWNDGIAFLFGLLSVQWTMTDYDATAHISEEVRRAAYAAPSAIFIAVIGTGLLGWLLNIVLILCSGPLSDLPGPSASAFLTILTLRLGKAPSLLLWSFVCITAFAVVQTALQAASRTVFAFSRDKGLPDARYFGKISSGEGDDDDGKGAKLKSRWRWRWSWNTNTPLRAIWGTTLVSILPGLLDLASPVAAGAVFSLTAMALDLSYIIPIFLRRYYRNHPQVIFKPGPFYMGPGLLGWFANTLCIIWTLFVVILFSFPTVRPVTAVNMNYASVITVGVIVLAFIWYIAGARKHYKGPTSNLTSGNKKPLGTAKGEEEEGEGREK